MTGVHAPLQMSLLRVRCPAVTQRLPATASSHSQGFVCARNAPQTRLGKATSSLPLPTPPYPTLPLPTPPYPSLPLSTPPYPSLPLPTPPYPSHSVGVSLSCLQRTLTILSLPTMSAFQSTAAERRPNPQYVHAIVNTNPTGLR